MHWYFLLPLTTFFINLFLAVFVLSRNPKDTLNKYYFTVVFALMIWCVGDVFFLLAKTAADAVAADKLSYVGSTLSAIFILKFFLVFSKKPIKNTLLNLFVYLYFLPYTILAFGTTLIERTAEPTQWGFVLIPGPVYPVFTMSLIIYVLLGLAVCIQWYLGTKDPQEKNQARLLIIAESIPLIGGFLMQVLPSILGYQLIPLTSTLTTVSAVIISFAMLRYGLMTITPEIAAKDIVDTMPEFLLILNPEQNIVLVNRSIILALGYGQDELIGKPFQSLLPDKSLLTETINSRPSFENFSSEVMTKTGEIIPVLAYGSRMTKSERRYPGTVLILRNVKDMNELTNTLHAKTKELEDAKQTLQHTNTDLEQKVVERTKELTELKIKLEKSVTERTEEANRLEKRLSQLAQDAGEWIWEVDKDGLYTYSSPVVEQILGYTPDEIVGKKHFYDFFSSDVRDAYKEGAFAAFEKKETIRHFANANVHKDGRIVLLDTNGSPILDAQGNLIGYLGADTDITERQKAEEALKSRAVELESINKAMIGRELKMVELKEEVERLKKQLPNS